MRGEASDRGAPAVVRRARVGGVLAALLLGGAAGGQTWSPLNSGTGNFLNNAHFTSDTEGWVTGGTGTLLRTTDGVSWTPVTNTGVGTTQGFNSVRFLDANTGWAGGLLAVTRTDSGGAGWNTATFPTTYYRNSHFPVSSTVSWAAGGGNDPGSGLPCRSHFRNTYVGPGYSVSQWNVCGAGVPGLNRIFMIDPDNGWSTGNSGVIFRIANGTSATPSFTPQASGTSVTLRGIQMLDASTGWIVGAGGTILRTTNGGASWIPQTSGTSADLYGVHFRDANTGFVVGVSGTILATTNGGADWAPETSGVSTELRGVFCPSAAACFAVGQGGVILKRASGPSPADLQLLKSDSPDPVTGLQPLTYTLSVTNLGPGSATSVQVTDTLPNAVAFQSAGGPGWACSLAGQNLTCTRASLAPGVAPDIAVVVTAPAAGGMLSNTATVTAAETDPVGANNSDTEETTVLGVPVADLSVQAGDGGTTALWLRPLTYTVTAANAGPDGVTGATLSDLFPASVSGVSWSCTATAGSSCTPGGSGNISDAALNLLAGGSATYVATGTVAYGTVGPIANTASVASAVFDPSPANNTSTVNTPVDPDRIFGDGFDP